MQIASMHFKERAHDNMGNAQLQRNLNKFKGKFVAKRRESLVELDDFEATREAARAIRQRALDNLDVWLEMFERNAIARGATVLWAETPADVNRHVLAIAARHGAGKIIKSKSMVSEESALDRAIEAAGLEVVETDLGEYILQINDYEPPSHIIGPALHKSKEEVSDLFAKVHGTRAQDGDQRAVPGGAPGAAQTLPDRRHGHLGRQFLRRRDRLGRAGDQRGQRDADDDAAGRPRGDLRHREDRPDARRRGDADAAAAALGDRTVDRQLRRHSDRHPGRGRISRRAAHVLHPGRRRAQRACSAAKSARPCAASAAARA